MNGLYYTPLNDRGLINVSGEDAKSFLQGLLTNDIHKVTATTAIYSCLLSPQGKYLYDFFVIEWQEGVLIDCHAERCTELVRKLSMYKLRSKVTIEPLSQLSVVAVPASTDVILSEGQIMFVDPRHSGMGQRLIIEKGKVETLLGLTEDPDAYERARLSLAIAEGEKDLLQDKAFPLEYGLDKLHAINYQKGCYVGQEVTARTTYRGVVRKQIYTISSASELASYGSEIMAGDTKIGEMRSSKGTFGLALIRTEDYEKAREGGNSPTLNAVPVTLSLPNWALS